MTRRRLMAWLAGLGTLAEDLLIAAVLGVMFAGALAAGAIWISLHADNPRPLELACSHCER